jgi:hypothetical protein
MGSIKVNYLSCVRYNQKKCGKKIMKCLESAIQPKGIGFDPFLKLSFFLMDKTK